MAAFVATSPCSGLLGTSNSGLKPSGTPSSAERTSCIFLSRYVFIYGQFDPYGGGTSIVAYTKKPRPQAGVEFQHHPNLNKTSKNSFGSYPSESGTVRLGMRTEGAPMETGTVCPLFSHTPRA